MKILTKEKLSDNRYLTEEGYLVCTNAILARTGSQIYLKNELFDTNDDSEIKVIRLSDQVFDERTIASFENKPVTIEHPKYFVNNENYKQLSVGFVRDVARKNINGKDLLVGNLIITDKEAIDVIKNGKKYLSCGYDCDIVERDGKFYQENIRGNHVALCDNPRAGITMIRDNKNLISDKTKTMIYFFRNGHNISYKNYTINPSKIGYTIINDNKVLAETSSLKDSKLWIDNHIKLIKDSNENLKDNLNIVIECLEQVLEEDKLDKKKIKSIIIMIEQIINKE